MATVVGLSELEKPFSLEGLTYTQAETKVFRNLTFWDTQFTVLKIALEKTPAELQAIASQHIANKDISALKSILDKSYEYYKIIKEQQNGAWSVLCPLAKQFEKTISYCTPLDISLRPEQLVDLEKHGFDLKSYPQKDVDLARSLEALLKESNKIQATIQKINEFIRAYPEAMNGAARAVKQAQRDKTWGDLLPAQLIGGTKYFYEGFTGFEKTALSLKLTEHSEETGTSATHLSGGALETPTKS